MAHELESMFYVGAVPWHGLGTPCEKNLPWDQAIDAGGLAWEVQLASLYAWTKELALVAANGIVSVPGHYAVIRSTDHAPLGVVSERYSPIQNKDAFAIFGRVFGNQAVLHTAGSLKGGKVVWGLAEFPEHTVCGEQYRRYLLVTTQHDGSGALRAFPTSTRVVCNNTLNLAYNRTDDRKSGVWVPHTGDTAAKCERAGDILAATFGLYERFKKNAELLAQTALPFGAQQEIVQELIPGASTQTKNARGKVLFLAGYGSGNEEFKDTAYGLFNGVTDFIDHSRINKGASCDRRFQYAIFGAGAALKQRTLDVLLKLAA